MLAAPPMPISMSDRRVASIIDEVSLSKSQRDWFLSKRPRPGEHQHVLHDAIQRVEPGDDVDQDPAVALLGGHAGRDHLKRASDSRDGVLHFMRNDRRHFAELRERLLLGKPLLERNAIAQVVQDAGKAALAFE